MIVQHAQFFSILSANRDLAGGFRDEAMAENIAWLHEQTQSGKKLVPWAHDWQYVQLVKIARTGHLTLSLSINTHVRSIYSKPGFALPGTTTCRAMEQQLV